MGLSKRQKLFSLGSILAIDALRVCEQLEIVGELAL